MAEKTMRDYLSSATADNDETLTVEPQVKMVEDFDFVEQEIHLGADGSEKRVDLSNQTVRCYLTLYFPTKTPSDIGTVVDYYNDFSKGGGTTKTFKMTHALDSYTYVVRFDQKITREMKKNIQGIESIRFRVLGYVA